jgi:hypothetical protein
VQVVRRRGFLRTASLIWCSSSRRICTRSARRGPPARHRAVHKAYLGINEIFFGVEKGFRQLDPTGQRCLRAARTGEGANTTRREHDE